VAALKLIIKRGKLTIINIYNLRIGSSRLGEWPKIIEALEEAQGEVLLLGDFNTYYSTWGGKGIAYE
jgi:endonuclease/exonuclease/phosphatase family metal-dependent hydrolase